MSALSETRRRVLNLTDEFEINSAVQMRVDNDDLLELVEAAGARCPAKIKLMADSLKAGATPTHCVVAVSALLRLLEACDAAAQEPEPAKKKASKKDEPTS